MGLGDKIKAIDLSIKLAVGLLLLLLLISFVTKVASKNHASALIAPRSLQDNVTQFIQESVRAHSLSLQDAHYVHALTHVNQAMSYLNAARSIAPSDEKIEEWTSVAPKEWQAKLDEHQAQVIAKMQAQCPNEFTQNPYMQYAGWT